MTDKIRRYFDHVITKDKAYQQCMKASQKAFEKWQNATDKEQRKFEREEWSRIYCRKDVAEAEWWGCMSALIAFDLDKEFEEYCDQVGYYDAL